MPDRGMKGLGPGNPVALPAGTNQAFAFGPSLQRQFAVALRTEQNHVLPPVFPFRVYHCGSGDLRGFLMVSW